MDRLTRIALGLTAGGLACVVAGVALLSVPAGLIVLGVAATAFGVLLDVPKRPGGRS